jgi:hypothetical protein
MANANPSRLGQDKLTGATDALFRDVFGGEVLTAYEMAAKLRGTVRTRRITNGKSATFPAVYKAAGQYHTPGAEIVGQNIPHTELTVTTDDLLIADAFVAQIDELKNYYDVRAPYSAELGRALAVIDDRIISMSLIAAARGAELFTGDGGGSKVQETDISGSADFTASGSDLWAAFSKSVQAMDEKDVPVDDVPVHGTVLPAQWYLMANSEKNINKDYGGSGEEVRRHILRGVMGVDVIKSNALLFGKDVTAYNASTNTDGLVGKPNDVKYGLPANFPSRYQADLTGSTGPVGLVWTDAAVARLELLGVQMEMGWDMRRQGTLILAKMSVSADKLRTKCAVEIAKS